MGKGKGPGVCPILLLLKEDKNEILTRKDMLDEGCQ